jgi:predicted amidophosphoribosyltransferase
VRRTADQIGTDAAARRRNVAGAFRVDSRVKDLRVAVLDDVMTTGATLGELARTCLQAGAREVEAWAIARVA